MASIRSKIKSHIEQSNDAITLARTDGTPSHRLWSRMLWLYAVRKFSLREITGYGLLRKESPITIFISKQKSLETLQKVNPLQYRCLTENKIVFDQICRANDLPTPRCLGTLISGQVSDSLMEKSGENIKYRLPDSFVAKPAGGAYGRSVEAWERTGDQWASSHGEQLTLPALLDRVRRESLVEPIILQERIYTHPEIAALSGYRSAQVIRMGTLCTPEMEGKAELLFAHIKLLGIRDQVVDNFEFGHSGNLRCMINLETGVVFKVLSRDPQSQKLQTVTRHPGTKQPLEGFSMPFWEQTTALVKRAANTFYMLPSIGWDVAITPTGPVLIEGNTLWDPPPLESLSLKDWKRIRALRNRGR